MANSRYYRVADGFTHDGGVAEGGQILREDELGEGWSPLSKEEQIEKFGRIMYEEVSQDEVEEELPAPKSPDEMTDEELRAYAQTMELDFPETAKRAQVLGAVKKKLAE